MVLRLFSLQIPDKQVRNSFCSGENSGNINCGVFLLAMNGKLRIGSIIALSTLMVLVIWSGCKSKVEGKPEAAFSPSKAEIREGDTITFINSSKNGSVFTWQIAPNGWSYIGEEATFIFTDAGSYDINLTAKNGDGLSDTKKQTITVLPDSIFRLSNRRSKTWTIRSILYNGNELLTENCQQDDEFIVYRNAADTCQITEGRDTCPDGTYIFALPATSQWRFNSENSSFEFALTAFGSPINLSFGVKYLTRDSFYGFDADNNVHLKMGRKR